MILEPWSLFAGGLVYLALLFLLAYAVEEGWLPSGLARHPLTYTASLGVYATTWSFYGSVGFAASQGYLFISIYLGATLAFMLAPSLLRPILRLVRDYQLNSLADLLAFRFPSPVTGVVVTLAMLVGTLPYISLQIQAVVASVRTLTSETPPGMVALIFCGTIMLFAMLFGARHVTPRGKHEGLVVAIAFESLIKLATMLCVAAYAVWGVFGGLRGLNEWLEQNPEALDSLYAPLTGTAQTGVWTTLLLLAFSAAFLLPRQFHMVFAENIEPTTLRTASWAFPLFLLLMNLAVPIVLWAGQALALGGSPDYHLLALTQESGRGWLMFVPFIGGLSAASAMIIVESLALASMCLNHLVLPLWLAARESDAPALYRGLRWARRALIAAIIAIGYLTYLAVNHSNGLVQLGLVSFVAVTQFLPGIVAMLAWPRANRIGLIAGIVAGMALWFVFLILPLFTGMATPLHWLPLHDLNPWVFSTFWCLSANLLLFVSCSFMFGTTEKERVADQACRLNAMMFLSSRSSVASIEDLQVQLGRVLGQETARQEIGRACRELALSETERRPRQLRFLYERLQRNLSGLVGPQLARELFGSDVADEPLGTRLVEEELEHAPTRLSGIAGELNHLRRFHRQILHDLPMGVCSLDARREVVLWNERMVQLSGIGADAVLGVPVAEIPHPWGELFSDFLHSSDRRRYRLLVKYDGQQRWLTLHKEVFGEPGMGPSPAVGSAEPTGAVLLVEDLTEQQQLEARVAHSARLASIGTLASGVAHEIGNPLTGIACIAQNLREEPDALARLNGVDDILKQTRRIGDIVKSLLTFARPERLDIRSLDHLALAPLVDEAIHLVRMSRAGREVSFDNKVAPDVVVEGDSARLTQAFLNLLSNAADASPRGGRVEVRARKGAGALSIEVEDWGGGIADDKRDRIFEPFFTTKDPGEGTGLGLPLVYRIVADHGGSITVDSQLGMGTRFTLRLPTAPDRQSTLLT